MKINRLNLFALVGWTLGMAFAQTAWAQDWPTRQPLPADPTELAARLLRDIDSYGSVIQATLK